MLRRRAIIARHIRYYIRSSALFFHLLPDYSGSATLVPGTGAHEVIFNGRGRTIFFQLQSTSRGLDGREILVLFRSGFFFNPEGNTFRPCSPYVGGPRS